MAEDPVKELKMARGVLKSIFRYLRFCFCCVPSVRCALYRNEFSPL